jgi:nucleoside-diphosphate-sugar epimerase
LVLSAPLYRLRGRRPPFSTEQLNSLERHWAFDDSRARAELDWHPRGLDEGLPPTVELLRAG